MRRFCAILAAFVAVGLAAAVACAHPALGTVVSVRVVQTPDGDVVEVVVTHDALAYALNDTSTRVTDAQMRALVTGPREELAAALQDGRERFAAGFEISADGTRLALELVRTPTLESMDQWRLDSPTMTLPCKMDFIAHAALARGVRSIRVRAPEVFDQTILSVSVPGHEVAFVPLEPGEESPAFNVRTAAEDGGGADGATDSAAAPETDVGPTPPLLAGDDDAPRWWSVAWRYIVLGFEHIVPEGHDHELFILGLFLLNTRVRDVLWQTTAFTIAHTCTLTLATVGWVAAPPAIVEPIIAASIAFIAIENLLTQRVHPWRPAIAFLFGLVHGMGFASGLREIGLPTGQLATALIAFNVGVEGGHLCILGAAYATLGWWRHRGWFRGYVAMPLSVVIAAIAIFWFVQRVV